MNQAIDCNGTYCSPSDAVKGEQYTCPDCEGPAIVKKGNINVHHFAHKANHSCNYFERTGEGHLHRYAKLRLKHRLETETITIERNCCTCNKRLTSDVLPRLNNVRVEHRFEHNGITGIADVHAEEGHESFYAAVIFEIYSKNRTRESSRPDDEVYRWYEIDANDVANTPLKCIRQSHCESCEQVKRIQQEEFESSAFDPSCRTKRKTASELEDEEWSEYIAECDEVKKILAERKKRDEERKKRDEEIKKRDEEENKRAEERRKEREEAARQEWEADQPRREAERQTYEAARQEWEADRPRREAERKRHEAEQQEKDRNIDKLYSEQVDAYLHPEGAPEPDSIIRIEGRVMLHPYYYKKKREREVEKAKKEVENKQDEENGKIPILHAKKDAFSLMRYHQMKNSKHSV